MSYNLYSLQNPFFLFHFLFFDTRSYVAQADLGLDI